MTPERAADVINGELGLDGAITHKGDEFKCFIRDIEGGGVSKHYLTASDCRALASAFAALGAELAAPSESATQGEP